MDGLTMPLYVSHSGVEIKKISTKELNSKGIFVEYGYRC